MSSTDYLCRNFWMTPNHVLFRLFASFHLKKKKKNWIVINKQKMGFRSMLLSTILLFRHSFHLLFFFLLFVLPETRNVDENEILQQQQQQNAKLTKSQTGEREKKIKAKWIREIFRIFARLNVSITSVLMNVMCRRFLVSRCLNLFFQCATSSRVNHQNDGAYRH